MNGIKRFAAGALIVAVGIASVGCTKFKTRDDYIEALTAIDAQWIGDSETISRDEKNFDALDGEFVVADDDRAQEFYDDLMKGYNGLRDSEVDMALYYVETSLYGDMHLNTYVISVTFKNKDDADLMYKEWKDFISGFDDTKSGSIGKKYFIAYQEDFNVVSGEDIDLESGVYQSGKQVSIIYSLHESSREDKAAGKVCKALGLVDPAKAK